jgi:hypothetical protein
MQKMSKFSINKKKQKSSTPKTATDPHPGDYDLGSLKSRAAARALAERMEKDEILIQIEYVAPDGTRTNGPLLRYPRIHLSPEESERLLKTLAERQKYLEEYMKGEPPPTGIRTESHIVK